MLSVIFRQMSAVGKIVNPLPNRYAGKQLIPAVSAFALTICVWRSYPRSEISGRAVLWQQERAEFWDITLKYATPDSFYIIFSALFTPIQSFDCI
jgi:hypothetical protein